MKEIVGIIFDMKEEKGVIRCSCCGYSISRGTFIVATKEDCPEGGKDSCKILYEEGAKSCGACASYNRIPITFPTIKAAEQRLAEGFNNIKKANIVEWKNIFDGVFMQSSDF